MTCGWMPKRAAWSRLIVIASCGALGCWSVETSASSGSVFSFSSIAAPMGQLFEIGVLQRVLELAARRAARPP